MKHSPGPYRKKFFKSSNSITGHFQIYAEDGAHIGSTWILEKTPYARAEANANLIMAVTDLLGALKLSLPYLIGTPEWDTAKKAIAKAEGGSTE